MAYDHGEIEKKAQAKWKELGLYNADLSDESKEQYYLLTEFPYPSGDLHIGHWYAFAVTDIYARLLRLRGKNVLFPIGFDAFGLPAENAAIKHGLDPKEWTYKNIERMRAQIATMGASFDWSKEVLTCDPGYYQWTQWLFTKLFEQGLAEHREASVKWCPKDQTVLANEQVIDGCCERCGTAVEEKQLTQWFLKITAYAERLLTGLNTLPWREEIKEAQRAWIGKSEGAYLEFLIKGREEKIKIFTTRPDTVFGATYVVLAPEHPLMSPLLSAVSNKKEIEEYIGATAAKTERERSENKEKTGVKLVGVSAINPATKGEIPIYIADYVLASYGTGAVMAVPAHDERDFEFAQKMKLPITYVIDPVTGESQENPVHKQKIVAVVEHQGKILTIHWPHELGGRLLVGGTVNEGEDPATAAAREIAEETGYTDLKLVERADEMVHHSYFAFSKKQATLAHTTLLHFHLTSSTQNEQQLEKDEHGKFTVEWVSLEQALREIHDDQHQYALARFLTKTAYTSDGILRNSGDFNGRGNHEAMPDIIASINGVPATQYRIRDWLVSRQRYWGCPIPIVYDPSGKPHAVPAEHLPWLLPADVDFKPTGKAPLASSKELQERVTKIFGEGWTPEYDTLDTFVDSSWYFLRYLDSKDTHKFSDPTLMKKWLPINRYSGGSEHTTMHLLYARFFTKALYDLDLVPIEEPFTERFNRGLIMGPDGKKMSKSKGNVVNPDEFVQKYGADAVRMYLAFIGPYNEPGNYPWNLEGVASMRKFLERVTRLVEKASGEIEIPDVIQQAIARASAKVSEDGDRFKFNTAVAALMILVNELEAVPSIPQTALAQLVIMLAPFAPHIAEHVWEKLGGERSVHQQSWPALILASAHTSEVVVQINGKRRGSLTLAADISEAEAVRAARALPVVAGALAGKEPRRTVYVSGRIINFVT
jgi:leucyl-tRNA synthetase